MWMSCLNNTSEHWTPPESIPLCLLECRLGSIFHSCIFRVLLSWCLGTGISLHILQVRHLPVIVFALGAGAGMLETQDWGLQSSTRTEHTGSSTFPAHIHMSLCVSCPAGCNLRTGCLFSAKPFLRKMHAGPSRLCMTAQFWASTMSGPWYSQDDGPSSLVWTAL